MEKNIRNTLHLNTLKFQFPGHFNFFLIYIYNIYIYIYIYIYILRDSENSALSPNIKQAKIL